MKRLILSLAAVAVLTGSAARAEDKPEHKGPPPGGGPRAEMPLIGPRLLDDLALTDEQKPKVQALQDEFVTKRDALRAEQKKDPAFQKLQEEMKAAREANDRTKLGELRPKMADYMKPVMDLRKQYMAKVRALLTPEQIAKLDTARERMQERIQEHRGNKKTENGPATTPPPPPPPPAPAS
jgi:Spy/CpxP family protein refolding chaperone